MTTRHQSVPTASHFYTFHPHHQQHYHDPALASLAYRPLQYPLQQLPPAAGELSLAAASGFHVPTFRHQHVAYRTRQQTRQDRAMASGYQGTTDEELAELQKLSNEYEPEVSVRIF